MNRFQKKRGFSLSQLTLPASILIFLLIFLLFYKGVGSVSQTASEQQMENLQQAIRRSVVHCYAVEGSYPESLDYLKEHYGITYDPEKYIVDYEIIGSNLIPLPPWPSFCLARKSIRIPLPGWKAIIRSGRPLPM